MHPSTLSISSISATHIDDTAMLRGGGAETTLGLCAAGPNTSIAAARGSSSAEARGNRAAYQKGLADLDAVDFSKCISSNFLDNCRVGFGDGFT